MERPKIETIELTTPTGYKVVLKKKLTYGEQQRKNNDIMGDMEVSSNVDVSDFKIKIRQASETAPATVYYHIQSWDATEDGQPIPITIETVKETLFEDDINFLMAEIDKFAPNPKKEIGS